MKPELGKFFRRRRFDIAPVAPQTQSSYFEASIPPVTGKELAHFEGQAERILDKDLSVSTFNLYVDTMIRIMGTHEYGERNGASSNSIGVPEGKDYRSIDFWRKADGSRSVRTEFHDSEGILARFHIFAEEVSLIGWASEAIEPNDSFASLEVSYASPWLNLKEEYIESFASGGTIETPDVYESEESLSLAQTHAFLRKTFDLYKTYKEAKVAAAF